MSTQESTPTKHVVWDIMPELTITSPHMSTQELPPTKHVVWDPMPELTITSLYVDSNKTWSMGPYAGVDYNLNLCRLLCRLQQNMVYGTL
jgi:hypothetical protein